MILNRKGKKWQDFLQMDTKWKIKGKLEDADYGKIMAKEKSCWEGLEIFCDVRYAYKLYLYA